MKLFQQDADLYFKLMKPLLVFVNKKMELVPDVQTVKEVTFPLSVRLFLFEKYS